MFRGIATILFSLLFFELMLTARAEGGAKQDPFQVYVAAALEDALFSEQPRYIDYQNIFNGLDPYVRTDADYSRASLKPFGRTFSKSSRERVHSYFAQEFLEKTKAQREEGAMFRREYFSTQAESIYQSDVDPIGLILQRVDREINQIIIGDLQKGVREKPRSQQEVERITRESFLSTYRREPRSGDWEDEWAQKRIRQRIEFDEVPSPSLKPAQNFEETKKKLISSLTKELANLDTEIIRLEHRDIFESTDPEATILQFADPMDPNKSQSLKKKDIVQSEITYESSSEVRSENWTVIYKTKDGSEHKDHLRLSGDRTAFTAREFKDGVIPHALFSPGSPKLDKLTKIYLYYEARQNLATVLNQVKASKSILELYKGIQEYRAAKNKQAVLNTEKSLGDFRPFGDYLLRQNEKLSDFKWWGFKQDPNYWVNRELNTPRARRKSINAFIKRKNFLSSAQSMAHSTETVVTGIGRLAAGYVIPAWLLISPMFSGAGHSGSSYFDRLGDKASSVKNKTLNFVDAAKDAPFRLKSWAKPGGGRTISTSPSAPRNASAGEATSASDTVAFRVDYLSSENSPQYFRLGDPNFVSPNTEHSYNSAIKNWREQHRRNAEILANNRRLVEEARREFEHRNRMINDDFVDYRYQINRHELNEWAAVQSRLIHRREDLSYPNRNEFGKTLVSTSFEDAPVVDVQLETGLKNNVKTYEPIPLPTPYDVDDQGRVIRYEMSSLQVRDQKGRLIDEGSYTIEQREHSYYITFYDPKVIEIDYKVGFKRVNQDHGYLREHYNFPSETQFHKDLFLPIVEKLEEAGFSAIATRIREKFEARDVISEKDLEKIVQENSLYSYVPESPKPKHVDIQNPFSELSHFVVDGVMCAQCSGGNHLYKLILNEYFSLAPLHADKAAFNWTLFSNGSPDKDPGVLTFDELHATTVTYSSEAREVLHSDATPSVMDPRNPPLKSNKSGSQQFKEFVEKLKNHTREGRLPIEEYYKFLENIGPYDHRFRRQHAPAPIVTLTPPVEPLANPVEPAHIPVDPMHRLWMIEQDWKERWRDEVNKEIKKLERILASSPAKRYLGPEFRGMPHQDIFKSLVDLRSYLENNVTSLSEVDRSLEKKLHIAEIIKQIKEDLKKIETRVFEDFSRVSTGQRVSFDYAGNFDLIRSMSLETIPMIERIYSDYPKELSGLGAQDFGGYIARRSEFIERFGKTCSALLNKATR
jgi:hypothetical protein